MTTPLLALLVILACTTVLWLLSLMLRDAGIIDIFWAPGFFIVAAICAMRAQALTPRAIVILVLTALWAERLGSHLLLRWRKFEHEDRRYSEMRAGGGFWWKSLLRVFWLQAVILWIVSWPLQAALGHGEVPLGPLDYLGTVVALGGILIEAIADRQLTHFKNDSASPGRVLGTGIWAWSRHPNYFGNATMWWGFWLIALSAGAWWTIFAPVLMTFFLLRVSGVALLERDIAKWRPDYADYIRRTSAFVPWPPKKRSL
jgi:steroid 5-alpha reductase family enzyme